MVYEDEDVCISRECVSFGGKPLPTRAPSAERGMTLPGLLWVEARRAGLLSTQYHIVLSYWDGSPERIVWVTQGGVRAGAIVDALREVLL